ncbi:MAG: tetratricopeptide repeat protein [Anaerolineae bacterium]
MSDLRGTTRARWRYLAQESALILLMGYVLLLGGTFNGLVLYRLNLINALLIAIVGALWLGWRLWRRCPLPRTHLDYPLLALLAAYFLATAFSIDPRRSIGFTLQMVLYALIFYLLVDLRRSGWPTALFVKILLILSGFILFFGVWELVRWYGEWLSIAGWANPIPPATIRIRAFLGHPNFVAAFLNLLLPLAIVRTLRQGWSTRILPGFWTLVALVLIFFTSSRGGWLGTVAALGSLGFLLFLGHRSLAYRAWSRLCRHPWWLAALVITLLLLSLLLGALVVRQAQHPSHGGGFGSRQWIWSAAWQAFRGDPLTGSGPFTFGSVMTRLYSIPPQMLLAHAHNYIFNTAAEIGLPGLVALIWLAVSLARVVLYRWHALPSGHRLAVSGSIAALVGCAVHSMFDTPQTMPTICVVIAVVLALLVAGERPIARLPRSVGNAALLVAWLVVTLGGCWALRAYAPFSRGVLAANLGDWETATVELDRAANLDPLNAFFHLQAGYACGRVGLETGDREALGQALTHYEAGVALEPDFCTNWANLGVLRWAAGDESGAIEALERAVALAPNEPAFRLTLGRFYEATGCEADARAMYEAALKSRPFWAYSHFFRATPLRAELRDEWLDRHPRALLPQEPELAAGWEALAAGAPAEAQNHFERALGLNSPDAYRGLGLAYLAQGEFALAEQMLRTARFIPSSFPWDSSRIGIALGQLAVARGDCAQAVVEYEQALDELRQVTSFGPGRMDTADYGWYIFNRESIMPDLLPGVEYIRFTDDTVDALLELGACYETLGDTEAAARVYAEALKAAPDCDAAHERLIGLGRAP